jgi:hypothetical protein
MFLMSFNQLVCTLGQSQAQMLLAVLPAQWLIRHFFLVFGL